MRHPLFALIAVLLLAVPASAAPPNILFIISDDQRADTIAALGNPHIQTPHLDRLVREGTVLTRAIAAYPICQVSRAEIFTGTSAFRNGVGYRGTRADPALATWAATLKAAGYRTACVGKWDGGNRLERIGFTETAGVFSSGGGTKGPRPEYVDFRGQPATGYRGYTFKDGAGKALPNGTVGLTPDISGRIAEAAIEALQRGGEQPFFLQVGFTTPHDPRLIPPGYEKRYDPAAIPLPKNFQPQHPFDHGNLDGRDELLLPTPRPPRMVQEELAATYAAITYMDEQIGRIVDFLRERGELEKTVIIFTSDQGLALGSHGLLGKHNMYDHTIHAPLIFRGPGIPAGRRSDAQCYLRDLFPTACELAGVPVPATVESKSLVPILTGKGGALYPFVVSYYTDTQRAIRTPDWKYIEYPQAGRKQLFHVRHDPDELHDLSGETAHAETAASLRRDLLAWLHEHGDPLGLK